MSPYTRVIDDLAINKGEVAFWPVGFTRGNYRVILSDATIWRSFLNLPNEWMAAASSASVETLFYRYSSLFWRPWDSFMQLSPTRLSHRFTK
ncbi:hypothetical protein HQN90_29645 [Paenibacillus alba]|uniref:hypothetical protein n=1 Tax=Paenibacillus alba TaxID=1197127 RepID=UPI001566DFDA|nr:hypothetical protein [Paenibacillus alba]NQX70310.1 hypothetical protein [Paenibacillus alba]